MNDHAPGQCETCKAPTPMRGIERCRKCGFARAEKAMEREHVLPMPRSEYNKRMHMSSADKD